MNPESATSPRRRVLPIGSVLSGVVALMIGALWVRSCAGTVYLAGAPAQPTTGATTKEVTAFGGYLAVSSIEVVTPASQVAGGYPIGGDSDGWNILGLHWRRQRLTLMDPGDRKV